MVHTASARKDKKRPGRGDFTSTTARLFRNAVSRVM